MTHIEQHQTAQLRWHGLKMAIGYQKTSKNHNEINRNSR